MSTLHQRSQWQVWNQFQTFYAYFTHHFLERSDPNALPQAQTATWSGSVPQYENIATEEKGDMSDHDYGDRVNQDTSTFNTPVSVPTTPYESESRSAAGTVQQALSLDAFPSIAFSPVLHPEQNYIRPRSLPSNADIQVPPSYYATNQPPFNEHLDSGLRFLGHGSHQIVDVPPAYTRD